MVCVYGQQMHALHDFNILFNTYTFQPRCLTGVKCFAFLVHNNFFLNTYVRCVENPGYNYPNPDSYRKECINFL